MLKTLKRVLGLSVIASLAYLNLVKLDFSSYPTKTIYQNIYRRNPHLAEKLLKNIIYWNLMRPIKNKHQQIILDEGIDLNGDLLQQLYELGVDLVISGPSSFDPHANSMGLRYIHTKINQFKTKHPNKPIAISILPANDVCTYTPYLISIDLCRAVGEIGRAVDHIFINLDAECFPRQYIQYGNISQLFDHINQKLKNVEKKPKVWMKYRKMIINQASLHTEFIKNILSYSQQGYVDVSKCVNQKLQKESQMVVNVKFLCEREYFEEPSVSGGDN